MLLQAVFIWSASVGMIDSTGRYTAPLNATGTATIAASAMGRQGLATVTFVAGSVGKGLPFGPFNAISLGGGIRAPFSLSLDSYSPSSLPAQIASARATGSHLVLALADGSHSNYLTGGVFDLSKWKARMDTYNTATIKSLIASAVADGTILGNEVMDEPHNTSGANSWGPSGTMTKAKVDGLCAYVKQMFPTLPVGVTHDHAVFEPTKQYRTCEFLIDQYGTWKGTPTQFRDGALAMAARDKMKILFSINVLDGGTQAARDGRWACASGRGTYEPQCRVTSAQLASWGQTLGLAGCGLLLWRWEAVYMAKAENVQAMKDLGALLATQPARSCRRPT